MTDQEECEKFAAKLARRFEEFTQWAIGHWPRRGFPLMESDFAEPRRDIGVILGAKLNGGNQGRRPRGTVLASTST